MADHTTRIQGQSTGSRMPGSGASFVPPSMDTVTGKSVMPDKETPGIPLVPSLTRMPETLENPYYVAGFLNNYLGKNVMVQFLIGDSSLIDRTGRLMEIGANFIVLQPIGTDDLLMCDLYSIKFVTIFR